MITDQEFRRACVSKNRINVRENGSEIEEEKKKNICGVVALMQWHYISMITDEVIKGSREPWIKISKKGHKHMSHQKQESLETFWCANILVCKAFFRKRTFQAENQISSQSPLVSKTHIINFQLGKRLWKKKYFV